MAKRTRSKMNPIQRAAIFAVAARLKDASITVEQAAPRFKLSVINLNVQVRSTFGESFNAIKKSDAPLNFLNDFQYKLLPKALADEAKDRYGEEDPINLDELSAYLGLRQGYIRQNLIDAGLKNAFANNPQPVSSSNKKEILNLSPAEPISRILSSETNRPKELKKIVPPRQETTSEYWIIKEANHRLKDELNHLRYG